MNEAAKTGVFWVVALAVLLIAAFVAWPRSSDEALDGLAGQDLFAEFTDPLAAASMRVVTFDEEQGRLERFEVRRDASGLWTIPSRSGYPADAVEQMRNAANSLIGLKVLDIQTTNAEDHEELGVVEPNLDNLEIGDVGVGRLVSFKDEKEDTLASLIIGDPEKGDPTKRYVRIPGQDPVYVVKLDESPLSTDFQDWIESDLLQLSSIDIDEMEIKDYTASLDLGNRISLTRNYAATVQMDGSNWKLVELLEYDPDNPVAPPTPVDVAGDAKLNSSKLNEMKNALDDLKLVSVVRKPDGMSANLRANQDFLKDKEAISSLAKNGFYPVPIGASGEVEILSANGEMSVTLKDGVRYIMRFGNISGFTADKEEQKDEAEEGDQSDKTESSAGVNRYMLVTAVVDESQFPIPDLKEVPKTLEDLDLLMNPPQAVAAEQQQPAAESAEQDAVVEPVTEPSGEAAAESTPASDEEAATESASEDEPMDDDDAADVNTDADEENAEAGEENADGAETGESESSGGGEVSGSGAAQEESTEDKPAPDEPAQDDSAQDDSAQDDSAQEESATEESATEESATEESATEESAAEKSAEPAAAASAAEETPEESDLTEEQKREERLEMLEAEQEKITKENQRKLDERNDKIEAAERQVRELNGRFADWYYVIAESTYSKLRISRDQLFETPDDGTSAPIGGFDATAPPGQQFQVPNLQP